MKRQKKRARGIVESTSESEVEMERKDSGIMTRENRNKSRSAHMRTGGSLGASGSGGGGTPKRSGGKGNYQGYEVVPKESAKRWKPFSLDMEDMSVTVRESGRSKDYEEMEQKYVALQEEHERGAQGTTELGIPGDANNVLPVISAPSYLGENASEKGVDVVDAVKENGVAGDGLEPLHTENLANIF